MTTTDSVNGHAVADGAPSDPAALRFEITRTREELGETIEALAAKADVKARAQESVAEARVRAKAKVEDTRQRVMDGVATVRRDPVGQAKLGFDRVRTSIRKQPAPWIVAGALIGLVTMVRVGKRVRR